MHRYVFQNITTPGAAATAESKADKRRGCARLITFTYVCDALVLRALEGKVVKLNFFTREQNKCALSKLGAGARSSARNYLWKNCTHIGATLALHIQGSCQRVQMMVRRHSSQLQFYAKTGVSVAEIVNKSSTVAQAGHRVRRYRVCIVQN
jgi:hypothetical protein